MVFTDYLERGFSITSVWPTTGSGCVEREAERLEFDSLFMPGLPIVDPVLPNREPLDNCWFARR
jgi:hypothetical protein